MHNIESRKRQEIKRRQRKQDWLKSHGPCQKCGSWDHPELDHINPDEKESHNIWTWSEERRNKELLKCQVLCHDCHLEKTKRENSDRQIGVPLFHLRKLTNDQVLEARQMRESGLKFKAIAEHFNISKRRIMSLIKGTGFIWRK